MAGDLSGKVALASSPHGGSKYHFAVTGSWWRAKIAAAAAENPQAHATPLFVTNTNEPLHADPRAVHVAVHIRRGDMVYRNFAAQLSPDLYYVNAMWHVLAFLGARRRTRARSEMTSIDEHVIFHVFTQMPPKQSWTGRPKVPLQTQNATYVDELGCKASLQLQLSRLLEPSLSSGQAPAGSLKWQLRLHTDVVRAERAWHEHV